MRKKAIEIDIQIKSEIDLRSKHIEDLLNLSYEKKIVRSKATIQEFTDTLSQDTCYVSTSGGKDSAVLSKVAKSQIPNIKHIMFDTGLEYIVTLDIAKKQGAQIIRPSISWVQSCDKHGYPIVSKNVSRRLHDIGTTPIQTLTALFNDVYGLSDKWLHLTSKDFIDFKISGYCCEEFKKKPSKNLKMNPIIGTRISESQNRKSAWKKSGCNSFSKDYKHGVSKPLSLWKDKEIERYVKENGVELSVLYTQYEQKRTGCKICPYGAQIDGTRFDLLKELEPKAYDYFIYHTKLGHILMISDVDIINDMNYMFEKNILKSDIELWHKQHKGKDKYLRYKVNLALSYFSKEELINALNKLHDNGGAISRYEEIKMLLEREE